MRYLMLDKLVEFDKGRRAVAVKNVALSEDIFTDHFPSFPVLPGAFIVESFEQVSRIALEASRDFTVLSAPVGLKNVKYRRFVRPGDQMRIEVTISGGDGASAETHCRATVEDREVARGEFQFALHDAGASEYPQHVKHVFDTLTALGH
jgi:3-hydroxyacyl-[acyl-carrier-protein] dehydratase